MSKAQLSVPITLPGEEGVFIQLYDPDGVYITALSVTCSGGEYTITKDMGKEPALVQLTEGDGDLAYPIDWFVDDGELIINNRYRGPFNHMGI